LWLAETIVGDALELSVTTHEYARSHDEATRRNWQFIYDRMNRQGVARLSAKAVLSKEQTIANSITASYDSIGQLFENLVAANQANGGPGGLNAKKSSSFDGTEREILLRLQTITGNAIKLAEASHMDAVASEQITDAIIIILSALVALIMALGVLLTVRQQMSQREKVDEALRESDIRLSDAFLKLKRASEQVAQTERLHTLENVSKSIVHDWKNALTPILASVQYLPELLADQAQKEDIKGMLSVMEDSIKKADSEVGRLGELLRSGAADKKPVEINKVVTDALHATQDRWKDQPNWQRIELKTELSEVQPIQGSAQDLFEAVKCLLINSADALPKGGTIVVRTQAVGQWVGLEISDTGVGMAEDVRSKCMEPFFSTKGPNAAGMGLTIASRIVKRYNGTIDIESVPGRGTTVAICLPVETPHPVPVRKPPDHPLRKLNILVVDDESWSRVALIHTLTTEGHTVETANNGHEGLEKFRHGKFDLVVTDHAMPGMSGEELAIAVKKIDPARRVILVTGYCDTIEEKERRRSGVDGVVGKPIRPSELIDAVITVMQPSST
jgi:signal transduction histidine kinase/CheY-like chemotaxis protein